MALNPALLAEEPEQSLRRLQRQRGYRIMAAVLTVAAGVVAALIAVVVAYQ
jgi:negative regulator of sigma E activity